MAFAAIASGVAADQTLAPDDFRENFPVENSKSGRAFRPTPCLRGGDSVRQRLRASRKNPPAHAPLAAPYGAPSQLQIISLLVAVALEIAVVIWAMRRYAPRGERAATTAVLIVVGVHFLLMAPAFGPLIALLGLAATSNALAGAYLALPAARIVGCRWRTQGRGWLGDVLRRSTALRDVRKIDGVVYAAADGHTALQVSRACSG